MKISIGTQNVDDDIPPSEIALSYSDEYSYQTNSLSYNRNINDDVIPIGILKKKKLDLNERENNEKRFCSEENIMRNMIFKNVNLCVDNLSKILSESCSNTTSSIINNNNKVCESKRRIKRCHIYPIDFLFS